MTYSTISSTPTSSLRQIDPLASQLNSGVLFDLENVSIGTANKSLLQINRLRLPKQKLVAFIGPNGAGKSTLLHAILNQHIGAGLTVSGNIAAIIAKDELDNLDGNNDDEDKTVNQANSAPSVSQFDNAANTLANGLSVAPFSDRLISVSPAHLIRRGKIAWVGQHERFELPLTALDYALLGVSPQLAWYQRPNPAHVSKAKQLLDDFELSALMNARVQTLSGGEQQRLAIVRALMQQTQILMFDEPTNHLDIRHQRHLLHYLQQLVHKEAKSIIVVLHDLTHAYRYSDEVVLIHHGRIMDQVAPEQVMTQHQLSDVYQVDIQTYDTDGGRVFV